MTTEIYMPNLGFDTQEARIVEWIKQPGDFVQKGDVIAVIESDKANVDLESIAEGIMVEHHFDVGTEVKVGAVIARIGSSEENQPSKTVEVSPVARRIASENALDLSNVQGSGRGGRIMRDDVENLIGNNTIDIVLALPKVRKAARTAGINLQKITPTGSKGQVTMADLQAVLARQNERDSATQPRLKPDLATPERKPLTDDVQLIELSRMRQTIGERLQRSMQEAPHFYVTGEFDLETAISKITTLHNIRINDLIQYLTVQSLLIVPSLNATYENSTLYQHKAVNLSIAVAHDNGLLAPVVHNAGRYSLHGLAEESQNLIHRTRQNRLRAEDLHDGTFTISNLGVIKQVDRFTAVINPPQVAILAIGTVKPRPIVIDGGLHIHHTVHLTLSGDHRVVDGIVLGHFMSAFQDNLDRFGAT